MTNQPDTLSTLPSIDLSTHRIRILLVLLVALFTSTLGIGIIVPFLPVYAQSLGATGIWIGFIFSGFSFSRFIFMAVFGKVSDRIGRKLLIATGLFLYALVSLGFVVAGTPFALAFLRFLQGFAAAMVMPVAQAYIGEISPKDGEGTYMGLLSVALFSGFGVGPLLGGVLMDLYGMEMAIYALVLLTFLGFLLVCFFLPELQLHKRLPSSATQGYLVLLKNRIVQGLLGLRFTMAMCRGAIITFVPIFAFNTMGISSSRIGIIISVNILATSALQVPFGILADKINRTALIVVGGVVFSCLTAVIPFIHSFMGLTLISMGFGAFGGLMLPAANAVMVSQGRSHGMASAMSLFNMGMSLGLAIGPPCAGWLADTTGLDYVFYCFALIAMVGVLAFLFCERRGTRESYRPAT